MDPPRLEEGGRKWRHVHLSHRDKGQPHNDLILALTYWTTGLSESACRECCQVLMALMVLFMGTEERRGSWGCEVA